MADSDERGAWSAFKDRLAIIRHSVFLIPLIVGGAVAWNDTQHAVKAADAKAVEAEEKADKNAKDIGDLRKDIGEIKGRQGVIIEKIESNRRAQERDRSDTKSALELILRKLDERQ
ncbi:MAG: hypothetical protein AAF942_00010 [Pseudomonadota bacterium]